MAEAEDVRQERVEPMQKGGIRNALHVGIEIPTKFVIGLLIVGAFNGGMIWVKFGSLIDEVKEFKSTTSTAQKSLDRIQQHNDYQDRQLADHESRLRTVERKDTK